MIPHPCKGWGSTAGTWVMPGSRSTSQGRMGQHFPAGWGGIKQTDSSSGQPSPPLLSKYWTWRYLPNPSEMTAFLQREVKVNLHRGASAGAPGHSQGAQDRPFTPRCKCGVNVSPGCCVSRTPIRLQPALRAQVRRHPSPPEHFLTVFLLTSCIQNDLVGRCLSVDNMTANSHFSYCKETIEIDVTIKLTADVIAIDHLPVYERNGPRAKRGRKRVPGGRNELTGEPSWKSRDS